MATVVCEIHHAHPFADWTGFYRLLDGELVLLDETGHSDFPALRQAFEIGRSVADRPIHAYRLGDVDTTNVEGFAEPAAIARRYAAEDRVQWNPNRELTGQGLANVAAGVVSGAHVPVYGRA